MLEDLQVFAAAASCQSFSEAARTLGLPSSSVSRRIAALEARLGTALFTRTTRHLELTEAGRVYHLSVQRALNELQQGESAVVGLGKEVRGTLVVDGRAALASRLIVPVLPKLLKQHPHLRVELRIKHSLSPELADGVDIGVRYEIGPDSELMACKFAVSKRVVVASPAYLAARGEPRHPQELNEHDCIAFVPENEPAIWRFRSPDYEGSISPRGSFQTNEAFSVIAAALAGIGIITTHSWIVADDIRAGRLVAILQQYEITTLHSYETPLYLIYNAHLRNVAKVRAFVDCIVGEYKGAFIPPVTAPDITR